MKTTETEKITVEDFFNLPIVKENQAIQKVSPFGGFEHRCAHIMILKQAKLHGVIEHFESLEVYDEVNQRLGLTA